MVEWEESQGWHKTVYIYYGVVSCLWCRITFTVVSDPENDDMDCEELGNAEVDLKMVKLWHWEDVPSCFDVGNYWLFATHLVSVV